MGRGRGAERHYYGRIERVRQDHRGTPVAVEAGRIMLARLKELGKARVTFAFETTLASRTLAPWLRTLAASGYQTHLNYFWLQSSDLSSARVQTRVREGGHYVPPEVVRRRYWRGLRNFFELYQPIAAT